MPDVSILEAWQIWLDGGSLADATLWGVPVLWWGRIGRLILLVSGLAILVEIIGPERLRGLGGHLRSRAPGADARDWTLLYVRWWKAARGSVEERQVREERKRYARVEGLWVVISLLIAMFTAILLWGRIAEWWLALVVGVITWAILNVTLAPILTLVVIYPVELFIRPMAWMLERPRLESIIKSLSVVLLLIGFHFEMLSS